jgi:hypothetical protein
MQNESNQIWAPNLRTLFKQIWVSFQFRIAQIRQTWWFKTCWWMFWHGFDDSEWNVSVNRLKSWWRARNGKWTPQQQGTNIRNRRSREVATTCSRSKTESKRQTSAMSTASTTSCRHLNSINVSKVQTILIKPDSWACAGMPDVFLWIPGEFTDKFEFGRVLFSSCYLLRMWFFG